MNESRRRDEWKSLELACERQLTECRSAVSALSEVLVHEQMIAVDIATIDEAFGGTTPASACQNPLPGFAMRV